MIWTDGDRVWIIDHPDWPTWPAGTVRRHPAAGGIRVLPNGLELGECVSTRFIEGEVVRLVWVEFDQAVPADIGDALYRGGEIEEEHLIRLDPEDESGAE